MQEAKMLLNAATLHRMRILFICTGISRKMYAKDPALLSTN